MRLGFAAIIRMPCARLALCTIAIALVCYTPLPLQAQHHQPQLRIRNNHELAYAGPIEFVTSLADDAYVSGDGSAAGLVRAGRARVVVNLAPGSEVVLVSGTHKARGPDGGFSIRPAEHALNIEWEDRRLGVLDFGLVMLPGTNANADQIAAHYRPLALVWSPCGDGSYCASAQYNGYEVSLAIAPHGGGWMDIRAGLTRTRAGPAGRGYLALVRRFNAKSLTDSRLRFNGRTFPGLHSPETWSRDFWYVRGVDWASWRTEGAHVVATSAFTPHPAIQRENAWGEGSHFWVREKTRVADNRLFMISEVAGPNPEQARSRYMPIAEYAPVEIGDTIELQWRLAVSNTPTPGWEESQLRVFAGYRGVTSEVGGEVVDLGVNSVAFGTSYFPYSTFAENFDFYRTPGLDRETWWPYSARMWQDWRSFAPRMQTDLHIIRAMGFDWVRLHRLELLQSMNRQAAFEFLEFFTNQARAIGLRVMLDSEGPEEWIEAVTRATAGGPQHVELENEILLMGIKPNDPARWTALYHAAKRGNPAANVFLTNAGNHGQFERLRALGVPFDRVGLHAYKHGPDWMETFVSHALGSGGYASRIGKQVTLGEFNWKELTRLSPEARRRAFATAYGNMLQSRAIPELLQFQFHETLTVNPRITRSGIRHYETISLDRRPKPEALELMRLTREYGAQDAPVVTLPIEIDEVAFINGRATASFTITNRLGRRTEVTLSAQSFDDMTTQIVGAHEFELAAGAVARGHIELRLAANALRGTYHHFLQAKYDNRVALGWGIAANPGAPDFSDNAVLGWRVRYPQGVAVVRQINWDRPIGVAFGVNSPVLEMEMAYMLANTLQSATGRRVYLASAADMPASILQGGTLLAVGTAASNALVEVPAPSDSSGLVIVRDAAAGGQTVLFTGATKEAVQAAATDFVLRYWPRAKDAAARITGMEKGAAYGRASGITDTDLP